MQLKKSYLQNVILLFAILFSQFLFLKQSFAQIDLNQIEKSLKNEGLKSEIHGSVLDSKLLVMTYRNPSNFFENIQFPLTSENDKIKFELTQIKRHQFYLIKGEFIQNKAPIKHINVTSLELIKDHTSELDQYPYRYKTDLADLALLKEATVRVHAVGEKGQMLVVEYKDRILPILVTEESTQKEVNELYRGDLIKVQLNTRSIPDEPVHFSLKRKSQLKPEQKPVEVIEAIAQNHNQIVTKSGVLVQFPKSPQIKFNIYALLVEDKEGSSIQFTLTNLENMDLFTQVREKIEKFWNEHKSSQENDRNKFINRRIKVTAKGIYNMIDKGQANPQILIQSIDDINLELQ